MILTEHQKAVMRALRVEADLTRAFGSTVHHWPVIPTHRPRWYQWRIRRRERRVNEGLARVGLGPVTNNMRERYWREAWSGQAVNEDAGGYMWRCWAAALQLPYPEPHQIRY